MKVTHFISIVFALLVSVFTAGAQELTQKTGYAPVNGLEMYYEIHGEGQAVVLVHGSFMTIDMNWGQLIPELAKTHKVIAVELQGHGHTADSGRDFSYANFASDISALLDHLDIEKADFIGYSLGATIALRTALDHPEKVGKVVFISSVYKMDGWLPEAKASIANMKPEFLTNTPLKSAYDQVAPVKEHWNGFIVRMIAFENKPFDLGIENIKKLKSPIFIINGDYDGVDLSHSKELFRALGGGGFGIMEPLSESRFAIIPGTTHVTVMMQTEQLHGLIKPFLTNQSDASLRSN